MTKTRNNLLKVFILIFCIALFLTGCATVSNVTNKDGSKVYFDDIQYFQGQVAVIGDYLYYGNGYTASDGDDFNYNTAASTGYLSRIKISENLQYDLTEDEDGYVDPSPLGSEQVNDEKLIGYENQYMFALGDYLYFTSANTHVLSDSSNDYTRVSLFRVKFNGDKFEEIDTFRHDENSVITVQKGSDNNYYYIIYAPVDSEATSYNLYSIKIGNKIGDTVTLAEDVNSVAVCDENSTIKNVVYTVDSERTSHETIAVKAVDFATGDITDYGDNNDVVGATTRLISRIGDTVFYSYSDLKNTQEIVYYKDLTTGDKLFSGSSDKEFYVLAVSDIQQVGDGYMFISDASSSVMYKPSLNQVENAQNVLTSSEYTDILFVDSEWIYYSNDTSISRVSVRDITNKQTLVTMTRIISGQCGYDGEYIYFYAQLESTSEDSENTDTNYYMYRVDKTGINPDGEYTVELLSKVEKQN